MYWISNERMSDKIKSNKKNRRKRRRNITKEGHCPSSALKRKNQFLSTIFKSSFNVYIYIYNNSIIFATPKVKYISNYCQRDEKSKKKEMEVEEMAFCKNPKETSDQKEKSVIFHSHIIIGQGEKCIFHFRFIVFFLLLLLHTFF